MKKVEKFDLFENVRDTSNQNDIEQIEMLSNIISKIVLRRMELNISQRRLAELTNIKQPMIARIETMNTIPRLDTLVSIITALDLKINLLDKYKYVENINIKISFKPQKDYKIDTLNVYDNIELKEKFYGA